MLAILSRFDGRLVSLLLIFGSAGMLAGALFFQEFMNLPPCVLCKYQRIPYIATIILSALAFASPHKLQISFLALSAAALVVNAGIAGFHVGVENAWWEGTSECGKSFPTDSIEALREAILAAPVVRCTDVAWSMFGISMAGYNMMIALGMGIFTFLSVLNLSGNKEEPSQDDKKPAENDNDKPEDA